MIILEVEKSVQIIRGNVMSILVMILYTHVIADLVSIYNISIYKVHVILTKQRKGQRHFCVWLDALSKFEYPDILVDLVTPPLSQPLPFPLGSI